MNSWDHIHQFFTEFGLSEKQIDIMVDLLEYGSSLVSAIAKRVELSRTTTYDELARLTQLGLVFVSGSNYGKRYQTTPLYSLHELLQRRVANAHSQLTQFEKIKHALTVVEHKAHTRPKFQFYEGKEGLAKLYQTYVYGADPLVRFIIPESGIVGKVGRSVIQESSLLRAAQGRRSRVLTRSAKVMVTKTSRAERREVKHLPKDIDPKATFIIFDDSIVFITTDKDDIGARIDSADLSQTFKDMFDYIWGVVSKKSKK